MSFLDIFLEEADELLQSWESVCLEIAEGNKDPKSLRELFRYVHTIKGSSRAVGLVDFGHFIHRVEDLIKRDQDGEFDHSHSCERYLKWQAIASEWISSIGKGENYSFDSDQFKRDLASLEGGQSAPEKEVGSIRQTTGSASLGDGGRSRSDTIRVSAAKCDKLLRSVGQIIMISSNLHLMARELQGQGRNVLSKVDELEKYIDGLYLDALSIRLTPLNNFFTRMKRLARDVCVQIDKKVEIVVEGGDVEIDRIVAESLVDPFVHIVRNAIDHGLESPSVRKTSDKPEHGTLVLKARNLSNGVEISIEDDGRGLDSKAIYRKAVKQGLVEEGRDLSESEIHQLILVPGFSTKEKISDLSGRGVGMDVVATTIEELGGTLSIESKSGLGSRFVLFIPANLTILDAFIVSSGENNFCVLMQEIDEIIDLASLGTRTSNERELVEYRDEVIPVFNIKSVSKSGLKKDSSERPAFICRQGSFLWAFEVDRILKKQKIMVSENENSKEIFGFSGVTMMEDSHPGMILSLKELATGMAKVEGMI